jgi:DNA invertase Pin-like site-specific DNA recombinase
MRRITPRSRGSCATWVALPQLRQCAVVVVVRHRAVGTSHPFGDLRSVAHMASTVEQLRRWGVGLRSCSEPWLDTSGSSPVGDLMLNILASFAQFERGLIAERVKAGMKRARQLGKHVGRPRKVNGEWGNVKALILGGQLSRGAAALKLRVSRSTVSRALKAAADEGRGRQGPESRTRQTSLPQGFGERS